MSNKVAFIDFWDNFDPNNNFLIHLFKSVREDIEVVEPLKADTIIFSCFGNSNSYYRDKKKIFFTGENKRPNFNICEYSISFDFDDYNGRNVRIPLWYYYIDWFNKGSYNNPDYLIPIDYLDNPNEFSNVKKDKFCSAVFSNPVDTRVNMINIINSYKQVDCYGKPHLLKLQDGERYKMDIISKYKFSVCFENSLYDGYYTEKLLHAKIAGNIPIYYSDKNYIKDFNPDSCLNLIDFENMEHLLEKIKEIDANDMIYKKMLSENLILNKNLDNIKKQIVKII
jgi:hypothetical protein